MHPTSAKFLPTEMEAADSWATNDQKAALTGAGQHTGPLAQGMGAGEGAYNNRAFDGSLEPETDKNVHDTAEYQSNVWMVDTLESVSNMGMNGSMGSGLYMVVDGTNEPDANLSMDATVKYISDLGMDSSMKSNSKIFVDGTVETDSNMGWVALWNQAPNWAPVLMTLRNQAP